MRVLAATLWTHCVSVFLYSRFLLLWISLSGFGNMA
jgi:hypothetical protein